MNNTKALVDLVHLIINVFYAVTFFLRMLVFEEVMNVALYLLEQLLGPVT